MKSVFKVLVLSAALGMCSVANAQADNSNSKVAPAAGSFPGWMTDYSKTNQGRISREAYMDQVGRRWDALDTNRQGMTIVQINRAYGYGSQRDPVTGTSTAPGNLGPDNTKK